ncbi:MAG TPA: glycosyltransferase family 39 protein, partial [Acidimicrobiales bacterium]|nr:glycosyltransferase family 39 protein [Acidimicrobiales bacterium]
MIVTLVAGLLRLSGLTATGIVFDEGYYVGDACAFVHATPECVGAEDDNAPHPPLGIWAIGFGVELLGFGRGGWRVASLAAGTLTVALLYLLARKVVGSTLAASVAAGLLAVDFLHFVHSRLAMLDVFLALFAVAAFLFVSLDR